MAKRNYLEANLQRAVVQYLILAGVDGLIYFSVPNGMVSDARSVANLKSQGLRPGVADLVIIPPGCTAKFLELKSPKGRLSDAQKEFQILCGEAGQTYHVSDNIDDAVMVLIGWGAIDISMLKAYKSRLVA